MMLATDLVVLDHYDGLGDPGRQRDPAAQDADGAHGRRRVPPGGRPAGRDDHRAVPADPADGLHGGPAAGVGERASAARPTGGTRKAVEAAKEAIRAGECFQIVVAQRFERPTDADPLDVYRVLRTTNPSPYMYLLRFDGFDIVGSSPEAHLKVHRAGAGAAAPDRRHPAGAATPRRRTPRWPPSCSPTRRSAPST